MTGSSQLSPERKDRRFADPAWSQNPLLKRVLQAYLAAGQTATELLASADLDWRDGERLRFVLTNLIAAASPSNNPLLNPAAIKALMDTGGISALRGIRALVTDLASSSARPGHGRAGCVRSGPRSGRDAGLGDLPYRDVRADPVRADD